MFKLKKKLKAVEKFKKETNELITFEELSEIPVNESIELYPKLKGAVVYTRINSYNENLMFTVTMREGQLWQKHEHDCKETIVVYKGKLKCLLTNRKADRMQSLEIEPFSQHYILSEKDSIFYVEFQKPIL